MEAGRRFVQNIECVAGAAAAQFFGELHALRLAAGERRSGLTEMDVFKADIYERIELVADARHVFHEFGGVLDRHIEDFGDILPFIANFQCLAVITLAVTFFTSHIHIRQKVHFDFDHAVPFTRLATPAFDVKAEPSRLIAAQPRFRQFCKEIANRAEQPGVRRRIRARRPPNRALININDLVNMLDAEDVFMRSSRLFGAVKMLR